MHKDLFQNLWESYPQLFSDPELQEIQCHEGWSDLLDSLLRTLQNHQDSNPQMPQIRLLQVKEKWGELRVYFSGGDAFCTGAIALATQLSLAICEACGRPGTLIGERWVKVRCDHHLNWAPGQLEDEI